MKHVAVAIIGTGFSGIGTAIRLKQSGTTDFVILERADDVGGVWRDNTYPNCACDVESHLYSFSFVPNPSWSHKFSRQPEIFAYLKKCVEDFDLKPFIRYRHEVTAATWIADRAFWRIETNAGVFTANVLVAAAGALSDPSTPDLPGLERFQGTTFHSARWNHDHDLTNKSVAVIGTGASAIQFVPAIQPLVSKLCLFQRTPAWVMPRHDRAFTESERRLFERFGLARLAMRGGIFALRELTFTGFLFPSVSRLFERVAKHHLASKISDPVLRKKLTPNYAIGCKRILISDDYLPAVSKPNVEVITESIREIRERSIVTTDGKEHPVDTIIFGTGFKIQKMPILERIRGRHGQSLAEIWKDTMTAYLGTTVAGFPNLFILQGPNTGLGHNSVVTHIESQIEHLLGALEHMSRENLSSIEPREAAQRAFVREVDEKMATSVWTTGGCKSWYLDAGGRNSTLWPGFATTFKRRVAPFHSEDYAGTPRTTLQPVVAGSQSNEVNEKERTHV